MFKQKTPCLSDEEISQLKANQLFQLDKKNEDIKSTARTLLWGMSLLFFIVVSMVIVSTVFMYFWNLFRGVESARIDHTFFELVKIAVSGTLGILGKEAIRSQLKIK